MADSDKQWDINPWQPITNARDLKYLGKLGEELSELGVEVLLLNSRIARIIIQGMDSEDPTLHGSNKDNLEDEIADVLAGIHLNAEHFKLDWNKIIRRMQTKKSRLRTWHNML